MLSLPAPNERTVCEINRNLLISTGDGDRVAQEAYGKILGCTYPDIIVGKGDLPEAGLECAVTVQIIGGYVRGIPPLEDKPEEGAPVVNSEADAVDDVAEEDGPSESIPETVPRSVRRALSVVSAGLAGRIVSTIKGGRAALAAKAGMQFGKEPLGIARWHKHRLRLAVLGNYDRVLLYDLEAKGPSTSAAAVLVHEFQRDVAAMEWRPHSGATLAVGCRNGICIWSLNTPISIAPPTSNTPIRGMRVPVTNIPKHRLANASMVFHKSPGSEHVTCLSWSPCGRLLASASEQSDCVMIWDIALGVGTLLRRGLTGVSLLKWSPTGDYLVCAKVGGNFYLWETNTWSSENWTSGSRRVVSCEWSPDGKTALLAFANPTVMGSIHFTGRPPSLDAHLLPVVLPEMNTLVGAGKEAPLQWQIELMAWDGSGERLAVSFSGGDEITKDLIAIYDTRRSPILVASFVGCIRGPSENSKPLTLSFHSHFPRGALLAVGWSDGYCCMYPMLFRGT